MGLAKQFVKAVYEKQFCSHALFAQKIDNFTNKIVTLDVSDVIELSLDCNGGPTTNDMYKVLVQAAEQGFKPAIDLIDNMGKALEKTCKDDFCSDLQEECTPEEAAREDYSGQTENAYLHM